MIGDVLTSSLLFEVLRLHYPNAQLDYLIDDLTEPVIANNPFIDKIWLHSKEHEISDQLSTAFLNSIKSEQYDVVIDVYAKLGSALLSKRSGAKKRISYRKWYTKFMYTHTLQPKAISVLDEGLAIENRILLLKPLLGSIANIPKPKIYLKTEEIQPAKSFLIQQQIDLSKPLFMMGILGSGSNKTYPLPYMAKLLDAVVDATSGQLLFNYIPKQQAEADALFKLCCEKTQQHIYNNVYAKDLRQFMALTAHCDALIGNEGGAVNMAKAFNVPTFSIFAPWILKEAWNSYEETGKNISVHLADFLPELYKQPPKKYKKQAESFYKEFKPGLIIPELTRFLSIIAR